MVLSFPNAFNKPNYNSYLSQYSNSYQADRFKCRKSFQNKIQNLRAYELESLSNAGDQPRAPSDPGIPRRKPPIYDLPEIPGMGWDVNRCFETADCRGNVFENDKFEMERKGCFKRQKRTTVKLHTRYCTPPPGCKPSTIFIGTPEIEITPPVYGGWIPDEDNPACKDPDEGCPDLSQKMASQLQNDLERGAQERPNCTPSVTVFRFYGAEIPIAEPGLVFLSKNADLTRGCPYMVFPRVGRNEPLRFFAVHTRDYGLLMDEALKRLCGAGCRDVGKSCPPYVSPTGRVWVSPAGRVFEEYVTNYEPELTPLGMRGRKAILEDINYYGQMSDEQFISFFPVEHRWAALNLRYDAPIYSLDRLTIIKRWLYRYFEYLGTFLVFQAFFRKVTSETFGSYTGRDARDAIGDIAKTPKKVPDDTHPTLDLKLCDVGYLIEWVCPNGDTDISEPTPPIAPPVYLPDGGKKKDEKEKCMEACSCEQVEKLLEKNNQKLVELFGLNDKKDRNKELWKRLEKIINDYYNKRSDNFFAEMEECCESLQRSARELLEEVLDTRIKIREDIKGVPDQIVLRLASEFAVIINKLNQILKKLEGNIWDKIIEVLTLVASLIGLLNDLRSLLTNTPDYSPTLQQIISLLNTIKDATVVSVAGSVDSIQCDGTRSPNSWQGQGIAGIAQGIQALAVNLTLLHADVCGLSQDVSQNIEYPMIRGRIDTISCDGEIIPSSWEGRGFDGVNQAIHAIGNNLAVLHSDLCSILERLNDRNPDLPMLTGETVIESCKNTRITKRWNDTGFKGLNNAILIIAEHLRHLHQDLCDLTEKVKKPEKVVIKERFECDDQTITVDFENEESIIKQEVQFLNSRITSLQKLICDLPFQCDGIPVFPGDTLEEREIPAQAVITFVESRHYPKIKGNLWHINIPYPKPDLIAGNNCWQKFQNLELHKGKVHGRVFWLSPTGAHNRFNTGIYGRDEGSLRAFLTQIASFSTLRVGSIRISTGGSPRLRPKDVHIKAVKVVVLERKDGTLQISKCCRAPKR